ncbi:HEAT repeat-containing protein 3 [Scleropages formosus]|uniref:HEAT repeat-containing protein 3 n=1 Tax=Scleropages formosus TaxID=113540 RepID=UPI000878C897|nr:HEAT repeat-containing protein 3 [Scleropages formosus]
MGKSKNKKFKRPQFSADGLPVSLVKEEDVEESEPAVESPAAELLDKLQSPNADVREYACASISRMVQQSQVIPSFLQRDAVRCLGPLLLDRSLAVRETAAGALRNLSACGGFEVCEDMVKQDVLTPLTALLQECSTAFDSTPLLKSEQTEQWHTVEGVANEAVNLLWNLCESCSQAVTIFNKAGLLDVLLRCLEQRSHNVELAVSAAHCLHAVTEENSELLGGLQPSVLRLLESVLMDNQSGMANLQLRTLIAGAVWNLKGSLPADRQAQTLSAVVATLAQAVELDSGLVILELHAAETARLRATADGVHEEATEVMEQEEPEEGDGEMTNGRAAKRDNDVSDLLPATDAELREATALLAAQQTSLEIIVNMCCSDDPSDDEWEEMSSSDESEMCPDSMSEGGSCLLSPLCLSAEVHSALLNHSIPEKVLRKTEFPSSAAVEVCNKSLAWKCLIKKMQRVQCRALTCLHNILSSMEVEALGGATALQTLAEHLSKLVFGMPEVSKQEEFLDAATSALRSLLQIMASRSIPQCISPQQLMGLSEAATRCDMVSVRVNALAILGITGSTLARERNSVDSLQLIGNALLEVATRDPNMVVCGEALDALFDVFADGKEAEQAAQNIRLLPALKALQPVFKAKLRKEGKGKYSQDQLCVLDNIRINLRRFIGYLESLDRSASA